MKKRITALALAFLMVLGTVAAAAGTEKAITVTPMAMTINGQAVTPTKSNGEAAQVFAYEGATYVPLRYLSELLGIEVQWDKNDPGTAKLVSDKITLPAAGFVPGTYEGVAQGRNGALKVSVTFTENRIQAVKVTEHQETPSISDAAIGEIPAAIVEHQTLAVDAIAGATITSQAVVAAVTEAVKAAGGDPAKLQTPVEKKGSGETRELSADVVVVGSGAAGVVSSLTLAQAGHSVILLEKMAFTGGSSAAAGGGMLISNSKDQKAGGDPIKTDPQAYVDYLLEVGQNKNDVTLTKLFAENCGETMDYLKEQCGITFNHTVDEGKPYDHYRLTKRGAGFMADMTELVKAEDNIQLMLSTKAEELVVTNGVVTGVKAAGGDGTRYNISGKAVVLATGGYSCNEELLGDGVPEEAINYGPKYLTGDGIVMAQAIGADVQHVRERDWIGIKPWGIETSPKDGVFCMDFVNVAREHGAIMVNQNGERFMSELAEEHHQKKFILEQEVPVCYFVMDQDAFDAWKVTGEGLKQYTSAEVDGWLNSGNSYPLLVSGATAEEAAGKAGIDGAALAGTVARFNRMAAAGTDTDFDRPVAKGLDTDGPCYILKMSLRYCQTVGGLTANKDLQVLDTNGKAIPGLYAAGETVSGVFGPEAYSLLTWAATSGRHVGHVLNEALK